MLSLPDMMSVERLEDYISSTVSDAISSKTLFLLNKADLSPDVDGRAIVSRLLPDASMWSVSVNTELGLPAFLQDFSQILRERCVARGSITLVDLIAFDRFDPSRDSDEFLITHARHRVHLETAVSYLDAFLAYGGSSNPRSTSTPHADHFDNLGPEDVVLAAEELRYAGQEVGKVSGAIGVEDILDSVFKEFCIGK